MVCPRRRGCRLGLAFPSVYYHGTLVVVMMLVGTFPAKRGWNGANTGFFFFDFPIVCPGVQTTVTATLVRATDEKALTSALGITVYGTSERTREN